MRLIPLLLLVSVFLTISGKGNANNNNASTQHTWVQQTPNIKTSSLTFLQAVKLGERDIVEKKLKQGVNIDDIQDGHYPPLFFASAKGYDDIALMLIQHGANPNLSGRAGWTPLMVAAMHGHNKNVTLLLDAGAKPELQHNQGKTALMVAIEFDKLDTVNQLIQRGANVNAQSHNMLSKGRSVLSLAVEQGNINAVKSLLAAGAHLNKKAFNHQRALAHAIKNGRTDIMALLLQHDTTLLQHNATPQKNSKTPLSNPKQNSALHYAAQYGTPEILRLLLASGSNPGQKNNHGSTALMIAASAGKIDNLEVLASSAAKDEIQEAFYIAITAGLTSGVSKLIALGADVNTTNTLGEIPLMVAVTKRHHLVVDILLSEGANIQAVSSKGNNALMIALATMPSKQRIVTTLINHGANLQQKNSSGNTALHIAAKHCGSLDFSIAEDLLKAGANQNGVNNSGARAKDLVSASCLASTWNSWDTRQH